MSCRLLSCRSRYSKGTCGKNSVSTFVLSWGKEIFIRKHPHPQYNSYLNENKFKKFKIEFGNIVWGKNWDLIFPIDKLYAGVCY